MAASVSNCFFVVLIAALALPVNAYEYLPDPTRPAAEVYSLLAGGGRGSEGAVSAVKETLPKPAQNSGLQSVIISPKRRAAVINGRTVELGEKFEGGRLIEVRESSVVLENEKGRQVVELFPGVRIVKPDLSTPAQVKIEPQKSNATGITIKKSSDAVNSERKQDERVIR